MRALSINTGMNSAETASRHDPAPATSEARHTRKPMGSQNTSRQASTSSSAVTSAPSTRSLASRARRTCSRWATGKRRAHGTLLVVAWVCDPGVSARPRRRRAGGSRQGARRRQARAQGSQRREAPRRRARKRRRKGRRRRAQAARRGRTRRARRREGKGTVSPTRENCAPGQPRMLYTCGCVVFVGRGVGWEGWRVWVGLS